MSDKVQLGFVGLGRMGANMVGRIMKAGHECVVHDVDTAAVERVAGTGAKGVDSLAAMVAALRAPRSVWLMVPAGYVQETVDKLAGLLKSGDTIIDGGNSYYRDDLARAAELGPRGIHYVDCGTSGGVWGADRGYCLMIGGEDEPVARLDPIFRALAPGQDAAAPTPGRTRTDSTAADGYFHCGPVGAGHFVKMVHNGIEYGMMASLAEGLAIIRHADAGRHPVEIDAETTPLREPSAYQYSLDVAEIAELWRRGSVVGSWLLDLTAAALAKSPELSEFKGRVSDSGEGRWTAIAAIEEGVPAPVIYAALNERFESRDLGLFTHQVLSAMRNEFGGHVEKP